MTPLRNQIEMLRDGYHSAAYPGDLASELLPRARSRRLWAAALAGAGLAAAWALMLRAPTAPPALLPRVPPVGVARSVGPHAETPGPASHPPVFGGLSSLTDRLPLAPPYHQLAPPALPSLPSWESLPPLPSL